MHFDAQKYKLFREANLVFQLIYESEIKEKTVISYSSQKQRAFFVPFILPEEIFFNICVLSQCTVD